MNATAYTDALLSLHGLSLPLSLGLCLCMCGSAKLVCLGWTNCLAHVCLLVCLISASALLLSLSLSLYAPLSVLHSPHIAGSVSLRALSCSLNVLCCPCEQLFKLKANDVVVVVFFQFFFQFLFLFHVFFRLLLCLSHNQNKRAFRSRCVLCFCFCFDFWLFLLFCPSSTGSSLTFYSFCFFPM